MSNQESLLKAKKRFTEINTDIAKMVEKLNQAHSKYSNQQPSSDLNWGHVGDASTLAQYVEQALVAFGGIDESKTKYQS
jgi:hypothetical protein